jgi:hypothetical protein
LLRFQTQTGSALLLRADTIVGNVFAVCHVFPP